MSAERESMGETIEEIEATYRVDVICSNCGLDDEWVLPVGRLVMTATNTRPCERCGCRGVTTPAWKHR